MGPERFDAIVLGTGQAGKPLALDLGDVKDCQERAGGDAVDRDAVQAEVESHPRHPERYSADAPGRFLPRGGPLFPSYSLNNPDDLSPVLAGARRRG